MLPCWIQRRQRGVRAQPRRADRLAVVVDPETECDGVATVRLELPDLTIRPPDNRFKTVKLIERAGGAGWIDNAILRKPDYLASIIEIKGAGILAAVRVVAALQSRKRLQ